jgi:hypothetical protein
MLSNMPAAAIQFPHSMLIAKCNSAAAMHNTWDQHLPINIQHGPNLLQKGFDLSAEVLFLPTGLSIMKAPQLASRLKRHLTIS